MNPVHTSPTNDIATALSGPVAGLVNGTSQLVIKKKQKIFKNISMK